MSRKQQPPFQPAPPVPAGFDFSQCRSLYIGNLHPSITDQLLYEILSAFGQIEGCKLIRDVKTATNTWYGFVDYLTHDMANTALQALNGKMVYGFELKVNWAFASMNDANKSRTPSSECFNIFVGGLSNDVDDKTLFTAFAPFGSITDARVMWDHTSGRSKGYGFVSFRVKEDAERALQEMNGEWLGNKAIRCDWANQKTTSEFNDSKPSAPDFTTVVNATPPSNVTVYVGNLSQEVGDTDLRPLFLEFGLVEDIRIQKEKGYAFVRFSNHDEAARAIVGATGRQIHGRSIRCSWSSSSASSPAGGNSNTSPLPIITPPPVIPSYPTFPTVPGMPPGMPFGAGYPPMVPPYGMMFGQPMPFAMPPYGFYPPPIPGMPQQTTTPPTNSQSQQQSR
mmetsp:Transcript_10141/g.16625  ORF Transcript_10141/g.16625 Transcript_10141/m.16625 type:complete len:394 (+) Transcript_10141:131-1312(+)